MGTISRYKYFKLSLSEGEGGSFHILSRFLSDLTHKLILSYPSNGEEREAYMIERYGSTVSVPVENILPTHDLKEWKLQRIRNGEVVVKIPVGVMLKNGKVCIFDGHHRVVCDIEDGKKKIFFKVVYADLATSNTIMKLIMEGK